VAADGRSYSHDVFVSAIRILSSKNLISSGELEAFRKLSDQVHEKAISLASAELELGEIPDKFLGEDISSYCIFLMLIF